MEITRPSEMKRILSSLTRRQHRIIIFITDFTEENGVPPVLNEIIDGCLMARSTVHDNVTILSIKKIVVTKKRGIYREEGGRPPMEVSLTQLGRALYQFGREHNYKPYS